MPPTGSKKDRLTLGCHLSIAKGLPRAVDAAEALGNNALQIFTHNVSAWAMKDLDRDRADVFRIRRRTSSVRCLVVHTMYLINLASPDDDLCERSIQALIEEIRRASRLAADAVVCHLGAHKGAGPDAAIERIVDAVRRTTNSGVFGEAPDLRLLLENTAGAGTSMGSTFEELGEIVSRLDDDRIGVCLDTCHAFAAGYDLRSREAVDATLERFDQAIGLERLGLIHLNDSRFDMGSHRDRHEHIGHGTIGDEGIRAIVNHSGLRNLPFVLETPKVMDGRPDADRINLARVRLMRSEEGT